MFHIRSYSSFSYSFLCSFITILLLSACGGESSKDKKPPLTIKPANFSDLPDWGTDKLAQIVPAFQKSCGRILKQAPKRDFGPLKAAGTYGNWQEPCRKFLKTAPQNLQSFFEHNFRPVQILAGYEEEGLFTGYYEASLKGSYTQSARYPYPLYQRPDDLVMVDLGAFRDDLKGRRIAGRVKNGRLKPYESRTEIDQGNWPHSDKALIWVSNPVDAFFLHIQGSGRVELADGGVMRVGYAGQNGHPYYAIGRELIKRGALDKEQVSMQSIRRFLEDNPDQAQEIMNTNASYVFFKKLKGDGAIGGEGLPLTPERSLAIDRSLLPYGLPLWVDIEAPQDGEKPLRRLMIAQDTGGAIRGPVRGDVFWGYGRRAEKLAGAMKSKGRYWVLLPQSISLKNTVH